MLASDLQAPFLSSYVPWYLDLFVAAWFFFLGGCIGSFLNVVVYRVPRGMTLVRRSSRCPYCCTKIRFRDNIPIFGWLMLRGRCRACHLPISVRYPLVETTVAIIFLTLAYVDLCHGGASGRAVGFASALAEPQWNLIGLYAFHCLLLSTLLTIALIVYDSRSLPRG